MTHDEMIAVIAAHRDGKAVEWRYLNAYGAKWCDFAPNAVSWDFNAHEYRIKPDPREWWVNVYQDNLPSVPAYRSKSDADRYADNHRIACVHVREVLP